MCLCLCFYGFLAVVDPLDSLLVRLGSILGVLMGWCYEVDGKVKAS